MSTYSIVASSPDATVVAEYESEYKVEGKQYQSESDLEKELIKMLQHQGYEYLNFRTEEELIKNLRAQLELVNDFRFSDNEWNTFFYKNIASANEGIIEKTKKIQEDHIQVLNLDNGTTKNIYLIDKNNIHNNRLQVINQYETADGKYKNRYDVTILVNGLPLVHIELKRRGVHLKEAFNQIERYQRDSFWASHGLFEYVQIFVISNGTNTKYYSNTTRESHIKEKMSSKKAGGNKKSHSYEFANYWADGNNKIIPDLVDFTKTFFSKHVLLNVLIKYCVFTSEDILLVMRPYQIAATERILNKILIATNYKLAGKKEAGGYIWHTTGSGKTLTSFKTAILATKIPQIDKVIFVVDRKDLDYQTMKEYDRFEKGAANGNNSTRVLQRQLENRNENGAYEEYKIIVTTIQKLDIFIKKNKKHNVYNQNIVLIFDECHRSQFGDMHQAIIKKFKKYYIFGFTGTPIFASNAASGGNPAFSTTEQVFGEKLHTYTIVDAIRDGNVLKFRIDYINTIKEPENISDEKISAIDKEKALASSERISMIVDYILKHFDQQTLRDSYYSFTAKWEENEKGTKKKIEKRETRSINGFNSIFAVASIDMAKKYYLEFKKQLKENNRDLKVATIFSFAPNEDVLDGVDEESLDAEGLDKSSRDFLEDAIADYNKSFNTNYDTSADKFQNYYKDLSLRVKNREVDILIVVNMFLTGFDATTLNTLWVDKNLRQHGLIQAFSRTNRILNSIKTHGNIVCFRNLKKETEDAIALFGDKEAEGIVLMRPYEDYYNGYYDKNGKYIKGYKELIETLKNKFAVNEQIVGEGNEKEFVKIYGKILKLRNILRAFDEFANDEILHIRERQDYHSKYLDIYEKIKSQRTERPKENINDDLVFEIELIKEIEVNIDYILMLVEKYKDSNCEDSEVILDIEKAIDSSFELRSKKELIKNFIKQISVDTHVEEDWKQYLIENKAKDIQEIIKRHNLKEEESLKYVENSFRDGVMKTIGTQIDKIMPPISLFSKDNRRYIQKQKIITDLLLFFDKYNSLL